MANKRIDLSNLVLLGNVLLKSIRKVIMMVNYKSFPMLHLKQKKK